MTPQSRSLPMLKKKLLYLLMVAGVAVLVASCGKMSERIAGVDQTEADSSQVALGKPGAMALGGTYANQVWWRGLTQNQRNELIRQTAYNHMRSLGGNVNQYSSPTAY